MAFVDTGTSRKILQGMLPMKITLAGAVVAGDPIMYSTGWKKALNTSGCPLSSSQARTEQWPTS